jgi:hypothetical protein
MTMFISDPYGGNYYIAALSLKGSAKPLWSVMPYAPTVAPAE